MAVEHDAQAIAHRKRGQRKIKRQPQAQDVLPVAGAQHRFDHHEVAQHGIDDLHQQEADRYPDGARRMPADDNRRNEQEGFEDVKLEADIHAGLRHQQRADRVTHGAQQPHHAQQLQDRNDAVPLLAKHQRHEITGNDHQPQQHREVDNPHHREQLVEVHAQLLGVVLDLGERREQHAGDNRVQLHRRHNGDVIGQVVAPRDACAENARQHQGGKVGIDVVDDAVRRQPRAEAQVGRHGRQREVQPRAVDLAAKVAEQQRAHGGVHQVAENGGHRQRPEMGADHGKGKARQHGAGLNHADLVELQLFLHQRAELLPVRDQHKRERQRAHERGQIRVVEHLRNHVAQQEDQHKHNNPQPNVEPVERGQFQMANLLALDNRVGNTKVGQRIGEGDNHQRDGQQAELVIINDARQHRHLHQAKADDDDGRHR